MHMRFSTAYYGNKFYLIGGVDSSMTPRVYYDTVYSLKVGESEPTSELLTVLLTEGEEIQLSVSKDLIKNSEMTWTSEDENIASVDTVGKVSAIALGLTNIFAENTEEAFREYIKVKVVKEEEIDELRLAIDLNVGENANVEFGNVGVVTWTSMDESVATIDSKGKITAIGEGLALVQGTLNQVTKYIYVRVR